MVPVPSTELLLVFSFGYELPLCITCAIWADLMGLATIPCLAKKLNAFALWRSGIAEFSSPKLLPAAAVVVGGW